MADYWIKLYQEIIDDPKMATLPDRLWRRAIEVFLLAGRLCPDKSGKLPDTSQLAWLLRLPTDELQTDLTQLATTGIIRAIPGGWLVVNFEKRQDAASSSERVKAHRERKQKQQYYGDETQLKRNVTQINRNRLTETDTETDTETIINSSKPEFVFSDVVTAYESNIGMIGPMTAETIQDDVDTYGASMCILAIQEAVSQNVRKWSYVHGILKNWAVTGIQKRAPANASPPGAEPLAYIDVGGQREVYQAGKLLRVEPIPQEAGT